MNTVQNGKGDKARNNWSQQWYEGYDAINWHRTDMERNGQDFRSEQNESPAKGDRNSPGFTRK